MLRSGSTEKPACVSKSLFVLQLELILLSAGYYLGFPRLCSLLMYLVFVLCVCFKLFSSSKTPKHESYLRMKMQRMAAFLRSLPSLGGGCGWHRGS